MGVIFLFTITNIDVTLEYDRHICLLSGNWLTWYNSPSIDPLDTLCCTVDRNVRYQPFLMCPGWSSQSMLLSKIYNTSLEFYIQWGDVNVFLSNRSPPQHFE